MGPLVRGLPSLTCSIVPTAPPGHTYLTTQEPHSATSQEPLIAASSRSARGIFTINGNLDAPPSLYAADRANTSCSPLQGDNCWYQVTDPSLLISEMASYNGELYMSHI